MAVTYTTAAKVASLLQVPAFSGATQPTDVQVEEFINRAEDKIDRRTRHAWRTVTVTEEYQDNDFVYYRDSGRKLFLHHRSVKTLASGSGDKLEIWNGSEWEDWLTTRTEGRDNDYWLIENQGVLYIKSFNVFSRFKPDVVRVTYRYGEASVPLDIEDAATKMAAIDILNSDDRSVLLPEGTSNIPLLDKRKIWKDDVDEILTRHEEIQFI